MRRTNWDDSVPPSEYWMQLFRVSKNQIVWGGNYFGLPAHRCFIVWDKMTYVPTMSQVEQAWTSFDSPARLKKINSNRDNMESDPLRPREGVQLLTTGNYFVVPPSIHPDTLRPYGWVGEYSLENFTVLDLEQLSQDDIDLPAVYISRFPLTNADGSCAMGSVGGRNDKLTVMCYAKIKNDLGKSNEEIAEELVSYDYEKHSTPYFSDPRDQYFRKAQTPFGRALIFVASSRERMRKKGHI